MPALLMTCTSSDDVPLSFIKLVMKCIPAIHKKKEEFEMCIVLLGGHKKTISLSTLPKCISMISFMTFLTCL